MSLSSFANSAARLATADADMELAKEAILEKAWQMIEDEAKAHRHLQIRMESACAINAGSASSVGFLGQ